MEAGLAEGRRLLVPCGTSNGDRAAKTISFGLADHSARRHNLGEDGERNIQNVEQFFIPRAGMDIEYQRATRVTDICDVPLASGKSPDQKRVDCTE